MLIDFLTMINTSSNFTSETHSTRKQVGASTSQIFTTSLRVRSKNDDTTHLSLQQQQQRVTCDVVARSKQHYYSM
jgi:hypothetical protein